MNFPKQETKEAVTRVMNLAGKTSMEEFMGILSTVDLLVTNDSGPMHLAAALDRPLVAIFGSTDPIRTGPYAVGEFVYKKASCSPCFLRECPIDFRCMHSIELEDLMGAARRQLALGNSNE